uniref:Uncharacterized protein n=1 Tax=Anguilla anguilla TaxID=7936 RepID=A0A0E9VBE6_ANGAN
MKNYLLAGSSSLSRVRFNRFRQAFAEVQPTKLLFYSC